MFAPGYKGVVGIEPGSGGGLEAVDHDGQVGTVGVAKMTTGAFLRCNDNGDVCIFVKRQHTGWAKFNTDMAAFTPLGVDKNFAARFIPPSGCCIYLMLSLHVFLIFLVGPVMATSSIMVRIANAHSIEYFFS